MATPAPPPIFLFVTRTVARVLFALPFIASGLVHFARGDEMAAAVPVSGGLFWVYLTGVAMVLAGLTACWAAR